MKIFLSKSNDAFYNLALEESMLKDENINEDVLLLYINENAIIIGRNQNLYMEINKEEVQKRNIQVVRRVSGGGAVYHDKGNVNFSFITKKDAGSYEKFLKPIIEFLNTLGLDAQFKGKNDLSVNDFKVSGNAQYVYKDRMFHHGTLLFDSDLTVLGKVLNPHPLKLTSKGITSVRQRVSNIRPLLKNDFDTSVFTEKLINFFKDKTENTSIMFEYENKDMEGIARLRRSDEWVYGRNPEFTLHNEAKFDGGLIQLFVNVKENKITDLIIKGDYLSVNDFEEIQSHIIDCEFKEEILIDRINSIEAFEDYFGKITREEFMSLFNV